MKYLLTFVFFLYCSISNAQIITTIAGSGAPGYGGDGGPPTAAQMNTVSGVAVDGNGSVYITDYANSRIRKVLAAFTPVIKTIAGTAVPGYSGDGGPATAAQVQNPSYIIVDDVGNVYFSDRNNHRVRFINTSGIITTIAGNGVPGFSGDGGPATAAQLNHPEGITFGAGGLLVSDNENNRIRKIEIMPDGTSGVIGTFAGTGVAGYSGDGGAATAATIRSPFGLTFNMAGEIFISDCGNHVIRKVSPSGIITTYAGTGVAGYSGTGGPATAATFNSPKAIAFNQNGQLLIAESNNHTVRAITLSGIVLHMAGNNTPGYSGDGGLSTNASLHSPEGVAADNHGLFFIADRNNHVVRKVECLSISPTVAIDPLPASAVVGASVTLTASVTDAGGSYILRWMNHNVQFATTTTPSVTYVKQPGIDTIAVRIISTAVNTCYDSITRLSGDHIVEVGHGTGVVHFSSESRIHVYPNPSSGVLHVVAGIDMGSVEFSFTNMLGIMVQRGELRNGTNDISLNSLPSGLYIMEVIEYGERRMITKVIKQ